MLSIDFKEAIEKPRGSPCFSVMLFQLLLKADRINFNKLAQVYPVRARMVNVWRLRGEILEGLEE